MRTEGFLGEKDKVIAIGEPRKVCEDYVFPVQLDSGLYVFVIRGESIRNMVTHSEQSGIDNEHDAMFKILGSKLGRFIGRKYKYGRSDVYSTRRYPR